MGTTLVIGATGKVGRHLVRELTEVGRPVRALVRSPSLLPPGAEAVRGDLADLPRLEAALAGVEAVFLLWPLLSADAAPPVVEAIAHHARRVVYLSSMSVRDDGGQRDPISDVHATMERLISGAGVEWTFLRPGGFASNTLMWAPQIRGGDVVRWPYGAAARSLIHERDIAAVAARLLTGGGHGGARYTLTGPEAITQVDQVRLIGEAIGRPLRYEEIPPEEARHHLTAGGWPAVFADGALAAWAAMARRPEPVTNTVEDLTGRPPRPFARWARDHAADFRP